MSRPEERNNVSTVTQREQLGQVAVPTTTDIQCSLTRFPTCCPRLQATAGGYHAPETEWHTNGCLVCTQGGTFVFINTARARNRLFKSFSSYSNRQGIQHVQLIPLGIQVLRIQNINKKGIPHTQTRTQNTRKKQGLPKHHPVCLPKPPSPPSPRRDSPSRSRYPP